MHMRLAMRRTESHLKYRWWRTHGWSQEQQNLLATQTILPGHAGEARVHFREAVGRTAAGLQSCGSEPRKASFVVLVIINEYWNENRGVEKTFHLGFLLPRRRFLLEEVLLELALPALVFCVPSAIRSRSRRIS